MKSVLFEGRNCHIELWIFHFRKAGINSKTLWASTFFQIGHEYSPPCVIYI